MALLDAPFDGVLNLTADEPVRRHDLYDRLLTEAGLPAIHWIDAESPRGLGKRVRNDRIKRALGFGLEHPCPGRE